MNLFLHFVSKIVNSQEPGYAFYAKDVKMTLLTASFNRAGIEMGHPFRQSLSVLFYSESALSKAEFETEAVSLAITSCRESSAFENR